jgi:hypothetical protein
MSDPAARLADEPDRPPMTAELAQALVSAVHRLAQAALTADAAVGLGHRPGSGSLPGTPPPGRRGTRQTTRPTGCSRRSTGSPLA